MSPAWKAALMPWLRAAQPLWFALCAWGLYRTILLVEGSRVVWFFEFAQLFNVMMMFIWLYRFAKKEAKRREGEGL